MAEDYSGLDPQEGVVGPPKTEEEIQQRMSGWQKFLGAIRSDPAAMMGTLRFATQMMQPVAPGQTPLGHAAGALEDSINYAATAKNQRELQQRQIAESEARRGLEGAQAAHLTAQTEDITAKTPGAVALQDALAKLYGSHANFYDLAGKAKDSVGQPRQILHSTTIENADGSKTIVNTHAVNGKLYIESYTPPRFTDEAMAKAQATKDVDRLTPFWGKAPYEGTKADEIRRRTAKYLGGQRVIAGPGGQVISPEQFDTVDQPSSAQPKPLNPGERRMQGQVAMTPEERAADEAHAASPANMEELKLTLANAKDPKIRALLQGELDRIQNAPKMVAGATGPIKVVQNPDGSLRRADEALPTPTLEATPTPAKYTPAQIAENPKLAQTTPEERAARTAKSTAETAARRKQFEQEATAAVTPRAKIKLFQLYSDVMTSQERKRYASGRQ